MAPENGIQKRICSCSRLCHGIPHEIPISTYNRHFQDKSFSDDLKAFLVGTTSPPATIDEDGAFDQSFSEGFKEFLKHLPSSPIDVDMDVPWNRETPVSDLLLTAGDDGFLPEMNIDVDAFSSQDTPHTGASDSEAGVLLSHGDGDGQGCDAELNSYGGQNAIRRDLDDLSKAVRLEHFRTAMDFIHHIEMATLDECRLDSQVLNNLREPPEYTFDVPDSDWRLALEIYHALDNAPQNCYTKVTDAIKRYNPNSKLPSLDQLKRWLAYSTGVHPIYDDMCIKSCVAFTGPFSQLDQCPECGEARYDAKKLEKGIKEPRQKSCTLPIGPQLQALWRHPETAAAIRYRDRKTAEVMEELKKHHEISTYDDVFCGSKYLEAVMDERIQTGDMILMFSIDGAQLYRNKQSDCWISVWVVLDHDPTYRYKKRFIIPAGFIPGPNKPKVLDSFIFTSFHHLSALQKEGLMIWDSANNTLFRSRPFLALGAADGPGMSYLTGLVGHQGRPGCRFYCLSQGRRAPGSSHYYPALLKPADSDVPGANHNDVAVASLSTQSSEKYRQALLEVMASATEAEYKRRRLNSGISKPSIFLGLPTGRTFGVPVCFGPDTMHLISLNIPDLLINLWRGTLDCDKDDNRATWDWAVLQGEVWKEHGMAVASTKKYLPGSFDRPPRNPAEKISSGYKAWEFLIYVFGLCPGLLYGVLPTRYWINFCKLVVACRIVNQRSISKQELQIGQQLIIDFCYEFERLYYQRRTSRLHMVRPCIHALLHLFPMTVALGPLICSSQWTMERAIGMYTGDIRQSSNPYGNLSQIGARRAQINALCAMVPSLEPTKGLPRGAIEIGGNFILLRPRSGDMVQMEPKAFEMLRKYMQERFGICQLHEDHVIKWGRLRLPNGQIARSLWTEMSLSSEIRISRNIKFQAGNQTAFGEVKYFFQYACPISGENTYALVSIFSLPDAKLASESSGALLSCDDLGELSLGVIDVKTISSVVAMIPHTPYPNMSHKRVFVVEKPGLDIALISGNEEADEGL